ncbi:MAG: FxsA family protein [Gemmatimonadota bacterium]|jgi:UPF0716 protein FxsA
MSLLGRLFLLFVGVPLLELFILVQVGQLVGVWPTIGLVVLTGAAGAALARFEGLRTVWKLRSELARGRLPGGALLDGFAVLVGGALLLTPGILTDLVGFSFLLPPTRRILKNRIRNGLEKRLKSGAIRITHVEGFPLSGMGSWGRGPVEQGSADASPSGEIVIDVEEPKDP